MLGLPLAFTTPWLLIGLLSLPVIWWLLRLTPPRPQEEVFPPTRILAKLQEKEETPAQSPWWLTLIRLCMAGFVIIAMAGPILNPEESILKSEGPVMIIMDDGWASAQSWETRQNTALALINEARNAERTVILASTAGRENWSGQAIGADEAETLMRAADPLAIEPLHDAAANQIITAINTTEPGHINWLSDGINRNGSAKLIAAIDSTGSEALLFINEDENPIVIETIRNDPSELTGTISKLSTDTFSQVVIVARDVKNIVLARTTANFGDAEKRASFKFTQPVEFRNQITRLEIETAENAASVQLLDDNNRRRLVGLISGEKFDLNQPLLSPLYYISNALEPFSDLRRSGSANVAEAVPELINQGVSAIALADIGTLPAEASEKLSEWIEKGGLLIRFAGPRLAASPASDLLPVEIRPGDRNLGGALSWETPKPLSAFDRESPFFGLDAPRDVIVKKQLLALQEIDLEEKTWAVLEDGTPLVTAEKRGGGWLVLFHVGSDSEWSNLPLSGTFVEMLRRTVNLAKSTGQRATGNEELTLPPIRILNASGEFVPPKQNIKSLVISATTENQVTLENPPGFYGTEDGFVAMNLFEKETVLEPLDEALSGTNLNPQSYLSGQQFDLKIWLIVLAALLLLADCIAVLWMSGSLRRLLKLKPAASAAAILLGLAFILSTGNGTALAQANDENYYSPALETRLAYVKTGVSTLDEISEAGMRGLTLFISSRTALEPAEPIGLDISEDELSFYSLIYWPIDPSAPIPTPETMARIDAYMKEGGSILFDTRDQIGGVLGGTSSSPSARALQQILSTLDIPPLEPVPSNHVLTKSFYLLDNFPGRYNGGDLWVEVSELSEDFANRPAASGDGVSSIMITSNDMAGAWAVDGSLRPIFPTIPADPQQRNYAFRSGVNLMMYALTGNYKADQVHLPALLERLGQ